MKQISQFNKIFLKPLVPGSVKEEWNNRFSTGRYTPDYMLMYLGMKKVLPVTLEEIKREVADSRLAKGWPRFRNSASRSGAGA